MYYNNISKNITIGAIHCPDIEKNNIWNYLLNNEIKNNKKFKNCHELEIITWNNKHKGIFEKSCELRNVDYISYGNDVFKWNNYLKFKFNIECAKKTNKKYIMGSDSHDVFLIGDPNEIVEIFKNKKSKIIFNSEINFYPNLNNKVTNMWKNFYESLNNEGFLYLNSGLWIGEKDYILHFFEECSKIFIYDLFDCSKYKNLNKNSIGCDQSSIHHFLSNKIINNDVAIDNKADIFLNIANLSLSNFKYIYKIYN